MQNDLIQAKRDAYKAGYETAEPLHKLIEASEVLEGARSWADISDERLREESGESASMFLSENRTLEGEIRDLAAVIYRESLPRAKMDHLATDNREKALIEWGFWPNHMDKYEALDIIHERFEDIPHYHELEDEAREVVSAGFMDGTHPRRECEPARV